ncbi:hypothetical protein FEE95_04780 [Maribacter algarum]|uniref:Uncharacterized protein n=1 Tax=Maribacter algarum (ex Zhang et al. 2020) TaxID=2578118 RepID=A0A5S3PUX3_9FLAO|nr:hypothetical protein [Maribacter algarum]TMM58750.1 hypothetical protein FEE95_04780 [Maribacter algarum]
MKITIKTILTAVLSVIFLLLVGCGESQKTAQTSTLITTNTTNNRATIMLNMNGKTYTYERINWDFSKVDIGNDILISIVQEGAPIIDFSFPASDQHFKNGSFTYTHPEVSSTNKPLYLSFFDKNRKVKRHTEKRIALRSGQIEVKRTSNSLSIDFDVMGSSMLDVSEEGKFPISGTVKLKF